ncbi:hypothetical protein [uncultured Treponema sp.]|uniref:hypothetical protein n=1 Tax=uncultured Treponema sp. TaxID=162155 RepID=UPI0025DA8919|nr:hypothetical protein [uncultured Treponema sp.]
MKKIVLAFFCMLIATHSIIAQEVFNSVSIGGCSEFSNPLMFGGVITTESVLMQNKDLNLDFSAEGVFKLGYSTWEEKFHGNDEKGTYSGMLLACGAYIVFNKGLTNTLGLRLGAGGELTYFSGDDKSHIGGLLGGLVGVELFPQKTFSLVLDTFPSYASKSKDSAFDCPINLTLRFNFCNLMHGINYADNVDYLLKE